MPLDRRRLFFFSPVPAPELRGKINALCTYISYQVYDRLLILAALVCNCIHTPYQYILMFTYALVWRSRATVQGSVAASAKARPQRGSCAALCRAHQMTCSLHLQLSIWMQLQRSEGTEWVCKWIPVIRARRQPWSGGGGSSGSGGNGGFERGSLGGRLCVDDRGGSGGGHGHAMGVKRCTT